MNAEIISIGDELTSGQRLDTNSQWLSQRLGELGVRVLFHTTVADDLAANVGVFRAACERADIVIATGGLGPTADDLTRQALAETAGVELVRDDAALEHIRALFARRQRPMPLNNEIQAMFPAGSRVIDNPHGSAPGIDFEMARRSAGFSRVFALPGVPAEMKEMWDQSVEPRIAAMLGGNRRVIRRRQIHCFGMGESDLEQMLPDLIRRGRTPTVGITVSQATITLRITAEGDTADECQSQIDATAATIYACLGSLVFGEGDERLEDVVLRRLIERRQTLCVVEFGSGGQIGHWLSEADPRGAAYAGGWIVRSPAALRLAAAISGQSAAVLDDSCDKASGEGAATGLPGGDWLANLAARTRSAFECDFCLAAGPYPEADSPAPSPGQVFFAVADRAGVVVNPFSFAGHPDVIKPRAAKQALNLLRLRLLDSAAPEIASGRMARSPSGKHA